ncbi:MAG: hypothetical protein ACK53Y_19660, partial [bacterium]
LCVRPHFALLERGFLRSSVFGRDVNSQQFTARYGLTIKRDAEGAQPFPQRKVQACAGFSGFSLDA